MKILMDLAHDIDRLSRISSADALAAAVVRLEDIARSGIPRFDLSSISDDDFRSIIQCDTPTHHKWRVYSVGATGVQLWLHRFRTDTEIQRAGRYAASLHNHRYSFVSILLNGAYVNSVYDVNTEDSIFRDGSEINSVSLADTWRVEARSAYSLESKEFHRIHDVADETVSLVLQLSPCRNVSYSVNESLMKLVAHPDDVNDRKSYDDTVSLIL